MSKLCAYRGALATAALSLALGAQAEVIEITIDAGSQTSATAASCTGFDLLFSGNDCTYNDSKDPGLGGGAWVGPRTRDGFYPLGEAQTFANTGIPAGATGIALSGTILIDDQGTADCADDTISGTIDMGPFTRNLTGNAIRQVENYPNGISQALVETAFNTGTANGAGGCDYTLGVNGVPGLLTGAQGDFPGTVEGQTWDAPADAEISRFGATTTPNPGASSVATIGAGYECLNNANPCVSGAVADVSGGFSFAWNAIAASPTPTQKASWGNIVGNLSTDGDGNLEAFLYLVHDDIEISTFAGQRNTYWAYTAEITGTGPGGGGPLPPVANDDSATVNQDQAVNISVLANDTNLTDPVTVTFATDPADGIAVVNGSPGAAGDITITYTPDAGFFGSDSFTYTVTDENGSDTATVTITVNQVGANDDTAATRLNTPVLIDVLANDVGFDDPVTVSIVLAPDNAGTAEVVDSEGNVVEDGTGEQGDLRIRFTPSAALGTPTYTESFTYEVSSGGDVVQQTQAGTYLLSSVVTTVPFGTSPASTFNDEATAVVDGEGNVTITGVAFSSANPNAGYTYTNGDWTTELGTAVTVTKEAENCVNGAGDSCTNEYNGLLGDWVSGFEQNGEPTGVCVSGAFSCGDLAGLPLSNVDVTIDGNNLLVTRRSRFVGDPESGFFNLFNVTVFTFTLENGGSEGISDTAEVTVTVNNALPVANDTTVDVPAASVRAVNPNTLGQQVNVGTLAGNSLGDDPATVSVGTVTNGTASVSGNVVTVTPDATFFVGSVTAEYTITDADGEADTGVITVTLPDVQPTLNDGSGSVQTGQSTTVALSFEGGNGSVAQHTLAVTTQATSGTCALDGTSVVYTAGTEAGSFSCVVTLTDGDGDADTGTFTFTVTAPPPPVEPSDPGIRLPGGSSSMDLLGLALLAGLPLLRRRRRLSVRMN